MTFRGGKPIQLECFGFSGMSGGEGVSQSPLKDGAFSTFQNQNPPFELRRKMGFRLRQKPVPPNGPSSTTVPSSDERKANCRRTAQPDRPPVAESDGGSSSSGPALLFPGRRHENTLALFRKAKHP